jgi:hypothetical protein
LEEEIRNWITKFAYRPHSFALNETMIYAMWRCACPHQGCDDKTMNDFTDKDSPIALLLYLKQDHVLCTGLNEDVWVCPDGDCTWEYKLTENWEEKISTIN